MRSVRVVRYVFPNATMLSLFEKFFSESDKTGQDYKKSHSQINNNCRQVAVFNNSFRADDTQ